MDSVEDDDSGEKKDLFQEIEKVKERIVKLKTQEQAIADEEESLMKKLDTLSPRVKDLKDAELEKALAQVNKLRPMLKTPLILSLSLGNARFFLPERQRLRYKQQYEQFKLKAIAVQFGLSALQLVFPSMFIDALSNFHLVYYYSTLTLREHIMVANGSHIRFWWRLHHYLCVVIAGVLLIWPNGLSRSHLRRPLITFAMYVSGIQVLQYRYQMRRLYTLRALSRVGPMETTTESATVHIKNDLAFLLPFLLIGHLWQFWLSRQFFIESFDPMSTWHVGALSVLFLMIGLGNLSAVCVTALAKYNREQ